MSRGLKERTARRQENRDRRPYAIARYIRIPSSKVKFVLDLIRGKRYEDAVVLLKNLNKSSSPVVLKVLNSAAANAENNLSMAKENLYVAECYATAAPTMKRMMPRARGRADRILKRACHITVRLDEIKVGNVKKDAKSATKQVATKAAATNATTTAKKETVKKEVKPVANKAIPTTKAEKPLTEQPNTVKPLGTKAVATPKKSATVKTAATVKTTTATKASATAKKPAAKKEAK